MNKSHNPDSNIQKELLDLSDVLNSGNFQFVLDRSRDLLPRTKSSLNRASCHFMIGCSLQQLGKPNHALAHLLEAMALFPSDEYALIGNTQFEIAKLLIEQSLENSAEYFINFAIANLELLSPNPLSTEMLEDCRNIKIKLIQKKLK